MRIVPGAPTESGHRLNLKQRMGLGRERLDRAVIDESTLKLPVTIDVFPLREDNEALYEWLAVWFANAVPPVGEVADPLQSDLVRLRAADATTRATLERWPGLQALYARLCSASLEVRPKRWLPRWEAAHRTALGEELARPVVTRGDARRDQVVCCVWLERIREERVPADLFQVQTELLWLWEYDKRPIRARKVSLRSAAC